MGSPGESVRFAEFFHGKPLDAHQLKLANATLAPREGELLLNRFNAYDIGQQHPAATIPGGEHDAVTLRVQLRRRGDFLQRAKHADLEAQLLQLLRADRGKAPVVER